MAPSQPPCGNPLHTYRGRRKREKKEGKRERGEGRGEEIVEGREEGGDHLHVRMIVIANPCSVYKNAHIALGDYHIKRSF